MTTAAGPRSSPAVVAPMVRNLPLRTELLLYTLGELPSALPKGGETLGVWLARSAGDLVPGVVPLAWLV